mmetsp:Transcript_21391/g.57552  ORF Transcript_21391/g.57552 Transcript_21391/m.57552 type:complete len:359 (+) Transcript_21391:92-1168(+)
MCALPAPAKGLKRARDTQRRAELLPAIIHHCEQHAPQVGLKEIISFMDDADLSEDYFDEHSPEEISHHIASVWAANLLLQVGTHTKSYAAIDPAPQRRRVAPPPPTVGDRRETLVSEVGLPDAHRAPDSPRRSDGANTSDVDSASELDTTRLGDSRTTAPIDVCHGEGDVDDADGEHTMMGAASADGAGTGSKGGKQNRRLVWTDDLHQRFEEAVATLGSENAKPQAIQQLMNVDGITTRNIKSHLQKYRLRLQKHPSQTSNLSSQLPQRTSLAHAPMPPSAGRPSEVDVASPGAMPEPTSPSLAPYYMSPPASTAAACDPGAMQSKLYEFMQTRIPALSSGAMESWHHNPAAAQSTA